MMHGADTHRRTSDVTYPCSRPERYLIRVPCTDSSAQLRVTSRHDNTSDVDTACPRNAAAEPGYAFVEEQSDTATEVNLCCASPRSDVSKDHRHRRTVRVVARGGSGATRRGRLAGTTRTVRRTERPVPAPRRPGRT